MPIFHALLDVGTHSLLALDRRPAVIAFLGETIPNSYATYLVSDSYSEEEFPLASVDPSQYPQWAWSNNIKDRKFSETAAELQTDEIRARSRLAVAKGKAAGNLMNNLSYMRIGVTSGIWSQERVYAVKRAEAERLRESGYPDEAAHEFPFVSQYADYAGLTVQQAADEILFRAKLDDQILARTEMLRIRYFNRLKEAETPEAIEALVEDYRRDAYLNGIV